MDSASSSDYGLSGDVTVASQAITLMLTSLCIQRSVYYYDFDGDVAVFLSRI